MRILPQFVINGWHFAPQCWKEYLRHPLRIERRLSYLSVEILGIYLVFEVGE